MSLTIYRSSAGSGKTTQLVTSYLKLCLVSPQYFRQILAITFTNKAAGEMKERVIGSLMKLSEDLPENQRQMDELCRYFNQGKDEIKSRSRLVLKNILHQYSEFSVSTIDSFNQRLIRAFSHEMGLTSSFSILLNSEELCEEATDLLIDEYGSDKELEKAFDFMILSALEEENSTDISASINKVANEIFNENARPYLSESETLDFNSTNTYLKTCRLSINALTYELKAAVNRLHDFLKENDIDLLQLKQGKNGIAGMISKSAESSFPEFNSYVAGILENGDWYSNAADITFKQRIDAIAVPLNRLGKELSDIYARNFTVIKTYEQIRKNIYYTAVYNRLRYWTDSLAKEQNLLPIADFNQRIASAIRNEYAPFIYEKTGNRFRHFLIDEFQDTSLLQWQNLIPLVDNSLAGDNFNLLVGDGKQSIYRWRGGKVEQFTRLPEIFARPDNRAFEDYERSFQHHFRAETLNNNYRSRREIVDFNNEFFDFVCGFLDEENKKVYENHRQIPREDYYGGVVDVRFIEKNKEKIEEIRARHLETILAIINEYFGENPDYSSICILCRSGARVREVAEFLVLNKIPVISPDSLLLYSSSAINFIISYLRFIDNPQDRISQKAIELFLLKHYNTNSTEIQLPANPELLPLYELCEMIVKHFGLKSAFQPFINYFLEIVLHFQLQFNQGIKAFLVWWEKNKEKYPIELPEGINAVQVMTIHKAKGLEFPVVIYPFADDTSAALNSERIWVRLPEKYLGSSLVLNIGLSKSLLSTDFKDAYLHELRLLQLDLVNLMYVAFTRPETALHIISTAGSDKSESETLAVNKLLFTFLKSKSDWQISDLHYCLGQQNKLKPSESKPGDFNETAPLTCDWKSKVYLVADRKKNKNSNAAEWGILVHKAISMLHSSKEIDNTLLRLKWLGEIAEETIPSLKLILQQTISHPLLADFFNPENKIYRERDIFIPSASDVRPDRVVVFADRSAKIVDFKTGIHDEKHTEQLAMYSETLREMKYQRVQTYIAYLSEEISVIELTR